jgi:polysaccharide deacetylase family protein (PEP-CTERM system associated)
MPETLTVPERHHLVTVALEDYFHVGAFNRLIQHGQWYRFETRVERSTRRTLDLLDEYGIRATFFVLGWIGEHLPEVVREVAARGHEIASKGYYHRSISQMTPDEFRDDLSRSREVLQRASGQRVLGFRVADKWFKPSDVWALDVLCEEGYEYDSSIAPMLWRWGAEPWRRFAHTHTFGERQLWEFPISSLDYFGVQVPIGGNWLRQLPPALTRRAFLNWHRGFRAPFVLYFHTWELDPQQPKISAASAFQQMRQYRNLDTMPARLSWFFKRHRFSSIAEHLGLAMSLPGRPTTPAPGPLRVRRSDAPAAVVGTAGAGRVRTPVTIVVPCYNEELILPYLANTLRSVEHRLGDLYEFRYVFVDDASIDDTWQALHRTFDELPNRTFVRHGTNRGVAAGIASGLRAADTEIVCSIDCDCTYDPHELGRMIPLLDSADVVTASPYHHQGAVRNVPSWRLFLSRGLSGLYRMVLRHHLATYTSCFRVYRRSSSLDIELRYTGFLGVAEFIGRMDLAGRRIVEFPTTLEVRMIGRSKMRVVRTIGGHLKLLARLAWARRSIGEDAHRPVAPPPLNIGQAATSGTSPVSV